LYISVIKKICLFIKLQAIFANNSHFDAIILVKTHRRQLKI